MMTVPAVWNVRSSQSLDRGRLRDVVIALCAVSTFFFSAGPAVHWASFVLLGLGCALHLVVKGQLIRNEVLCTRGAYAVVRHPYYLANYLIDISFCLLSGNVYLVLCYPFLFFWAYGSTLRSEESRLASLHGSDFEAYRVSVPAIFPSAPLSASLRTFREGFSWRRISIGEIKRLFRFGCIGAFLALFQQIGREGWKDIFAGQNPLDLAGMALLTFCMLLLLATALMPRGKVSHPGDSH